MYSIDDLRRELDEETRDLAPRVTLAEVRARAARRRWRGAVGVFLAALVPVVAAGTVAALHPAGYTPVPTPEPTAIAAPPADPSPVQVTPEPAPSAPRAETAASSAPLSGPNIATGLPVGDKERLMLYYRDGSNGVKGALANPSTGAVRELQDGAVAQPGMFSTVYEVDDRRGGAIDYGVFAGTGVTIQASVDGRPVKVNTGRLAQVPDLTVFWFARTGVFVAPTGEPATRPGVVVTAHDARGATIGTSGHMQRSDGIVVRDDNAEPVGDRIRTGVTLADGGELVFWFVGDAKEALIHSGSRDSTGTVKALKVVGVFRRPPFASGFYLGVFTFDVPGGKLWVARYVGAAQTVTMEGPKVAQAGAGRWSAHPEARLLWGAGPDRPTGVARDAQGAVVETSTFT